MTTFSNIEILQIEHLSFGERIAYAIEAKGISKAWIAERLGISKQALNYLLRHSIKPKFVDEFAEILGLDPLWIEKGVGKLPTFEAIPSHKESKIFIVNNEILLGKATLNEQKCPSIDFNHQLEDRFIAYKLIDDSNFPPFIQDSILIFNSKKAPLHQDYVLFNMDDNIFVRQYLIDGSNICYMASNHQHKTFINPEATILGVLVEVRYQL